MRPYKASLAEPWKEDSKWTGLYYRDGNWHEIKTRFDTARDAIAEAKRIVTESSK